MNSHPTTTLRQARQDDLPAINRVIKLAIMAWELPERVKRLSLPSYRYNENDLGHLHIIVAEQGEGHIIGVAAWDVADPDDLPAGKSGMLLHGIYVHPNHQHHGIGRQLLNAARQNAAQAGVDGLLAKAQPDARGFFLSHGMDTLPVSDPNRDYPYRYWLAARGTNP